MSEEKRPLPEEELPETPSVRWASEKARRNREILRKTATIERAISGIDRRVLIAIML